MVPSWTPLPSTGVPHLGGGDVVSSVRTDQRQRRESSHDLVARLRAPEALQQFLQDQARRVDRLSRCEARAQPLDLGTIGRRVAAKCQGPHARIDEQPQALSRSAL